MKREVINDQVNFPGQAQLPPMPKAPSARVWVYLVVLGRILYIAQGALIFYDVQHRIWWAVVIMGLLAAAMGYTEGRYHWSGFRLIRAQAQLIESMYPLMKAHPLHEIARDDIEQP